MTVDFKDKHYSYVGRNGFGLCRGLDISPSYDKKVLIALTLNPINSKGSLASGCSIDLPIEYVSEVCAAIQSDLIGKILDRVPDRLPTLLGINPSLDKIVEQRLKGV